MKVNNRKRDRIKQRHRSHDEKSRTSANEKEDARVVSLEIQRVQSFLKKGGLEGLIESPADSLPGEVDLVCFSHLRWDFVYQRPQHLLSRFAKERRVFFIEEPVFGEGEMRLDVSRRKDGLYVVVPHLSHALNKDVSLDTVQQGLVERLFKDYEIEDYFLWYYTPIAMGFTRHLQPLAVVYDCMDELAAFKGAPPALRFREKELFNRADLIFTGGHSLYEAKRKEHPCVFAFPSSIDVVHFAQARSVGAEPLDQKNIPHPRLGFFGVLDERLDIALVDELAAARPDWQLVMVGPVVKINPEDLPRRANIHYLGGKDYQELPAYLAGWTVALLPFARNDSTRFISPTKTPEYLAAGKPVVSTSIRDVVRPYGERGLVRIADRVEDFVAAIRAAMQEDARERLRQVDAFLAQTSWDRTWAEMRQLIAEVVGARLAVKSGAQAATAGGRAPVSRAASAGKGVAG
jgi:UDP-galactopyranose mutase